MTRLRARKASAPDAFREARRCFLKGQRIDMQTLAQALAVDRTTLFRWVGSREQLITDVLWQMLDDTLSRLEAAVKPASAATATVVSGATRAVIANAGMQAFMRSEGQLAMRLLTTTASAFQQRLIHRIGQVVSADRKAGLLHSPVPPADLPYVLVRIMESYVYLPLITGDVPDVARATRVIRALAPRPR